jgi:hypothetical protein
MGGGSLPLVAFTTPFGRVAQSAFLATRDYKPIPEIARDEKLIMPGLLHIHVGAGSFGRGPKPIGARVVVIMPRGENDPAKAIQPVKSDKKTSTYSNAFGASWEADSIDADFPLAAFDDGNEVRVVWENGEERKLPLKTKGHR